VLETDFYKGSPAEHLRTTQTPFRRRLVALDEGADQTLLFELARDGGTDYFAAPVELGAPCRDRDGFQHKSHVWFDDDEEAPVASWSVEFPLPC